MRWETLRSVDVFDGALNIHGERRYSVLGLELNERRWLTEWIDSYSPPHDGRGDPRLQGEEVPVELQAMRTKNTDLT